METKIVSGDALRSVANRLISEAADGSDSLAMVAVLVIGGDRLACCDEGVVFADDELRGIATIAPDGEEGGGVPTIVGVFVRADDRGRGYGTELLAAAVCRCVERGFDRVRLDTLTRGALRAVEKLPPELRVRLDVRSFVLF